MEAALKIKLKMYGKSSNTPTNTSVNISDPKES